VFIQLIITHKIRSSFISETEEGARGQDSRETERESEEKRENKHWVAVGIASVVNRTIRKYTCLISKMSQHLERLLLISKIRNLANDVSHV
jgi:hypothetical protein